MVGTVNALGQPVTTCYQRTRVHPDSESWTHYQYAILADGSWAFPNRVRRRGDRAPWGTWHPAVNPPVNRLDEFTQVYPGSGGSDSPAPVDTISEQGEQGQPVGNPAACSQGTGQ